MSLRLLLDRLLGCALISAGPLPALTSLFARHLAGTSVLEWTKANCYCFICFERDEHGKRCKWQLLLCYDKSPYSVLIHGRPLLMQKSQTIKCKILFGVERGNIVSARRLINMLLVGMQLDSLQIKLGSRILICHNPCTSKLISMQFYTR